MRNKKTIAQLEERRRKLLNKLVSVASELRDIDRDIRKMKTRKLKMPPPKGVKVMIDKSNPDGLTHADFNDVLPSFGPR